MLYVLAVQCFILYLSPSHTLTLVTVANPSSRCVYFSCIEQKATNEWNEIKWKKKQQHLRREKTITQHWYTERLRYCPLKSICCYFVFVASRLLSDWLCRLLYYFFFRVHSLYFIYFTHTHRYVFRFDVLFFLSQLMYIINLLNVVMWRIRIRFTKIIILHRQNRCDRIVALCIFSHYISIWLYVSIANLLGVKIFNGYDIICDSCRIFWQGEREKESNRTDVITFIHSATINRSKYFTLNIFALPQYCGYT